MLDLLAPLGRPPLDTFSPTQMVRTAEPMPAGVWEIEGGAAIYADPTLSTGPGPRPLGAIRFGIAPGIDMSAGAPGPGRRMLAVRYAPIPALWSLDLGSDAPPPFGRMAVEAGTTLELALPLLTPRIAPRFQYALAGTSRGGFSDAFYPRVALGAETRALKPVALGIDYDYGFSAESTLSIGARFRLVGNLGGALFAAFPTWALTDPSTYKAGALAAMRF